MNEESVAWLAHAISGLPSDGPVERGSVGYNNYQTQKDHWLGWLDPHSGTGTYARQDQPARGARYVYNHIMEPRMLLWLAEAAGLPGGLASKARAAAEQSGTLAGKCAAIRKEIPWPTVADALALRGA